MYKKNTVFSSDAKCVYTYKRHARKYSFWLRKLYFSELFEGDQEIPYNFSKFSSVYIHQVSLH